MSKLKQSTSLTNNLSNNRLETSKKPAHDNSKNLTRELRNELLFKMCNGERNIEALSKQYGVPIDTLCEWQTLCKDFVKVLNKERQIEAPTFQCLYKGKRISFDQLVIIFSLTK